MSAIKQGKYEFKKESLVDVRKQMGISQGKMADLLGVPANTLSRWEVGTTAPDAKHLAAFYSVAKEHGITPAFFGILGDSKTFQYKLIVLWDFQTVGAHASWVPYTHNTIATELNKRFSGMKPLLKAFAHPTQSDAIKELKKLGWRVTEGENEVFDYINEDAKSDSGHNPEGTVLVLISKDEAFTELIDELINRGVHLYVISPQALNGRFNNKLIEKVGPDYSIPWYPVSLDQPKRTINNSPGLWDMNNYLTGV